jgi:hypothetical protein
MSKNFQALIVGLVAGLVMLGAACLGFTMAVWAQPAQPAQHTLQLPQRQHDSWHPQAEDDYPACWLEYNASQPGGVEPICGPMWAINPLITVKDSVQTVSGK